MWRCEGVWKEKECDRCTIAPLGPEELMEPAPRKAQQMKTSGTL